MKRIGLLALLVLFWMFPMETFAFKWTLASTYQSNTAGYGRDSDFDTSSIACPDGKYVHSLGYFTKTEVLVYHGARINGIVLKCVGLDSNGRMDFSNVYYKTWPGQRDQIGIAHTWESFLDAHAADLDGLFANNDYYPDTTFMYGIKVNGANDNVNRAIYNMKLRMRRFDQYDASTTRVTLINSPEWFALSVNYPSVSDAYWDFDNIDSVSCLPSGQNYNPDTDKIHVVRGMKIWHKVNAGTVPQTRHVGRVKLLCAELKRSK